MNIQGIISNKRIILAFGMIVAVAAILISGTGAFFSDTETSTGNIFTAGSIDLKVDHTRQTYNGVDCATCNVDLYSDTTNVVVATDNGSEAGSLPKNAEIVTPTTVTDEHWTASIPGAKWIWVTSEVTLGDVQNDVIYTFEKEFEWQGPFEGATVEFAVAADNSYEVWLNGVKIGEDTAENNHGSSDSIAITALEQGTNVLQFKVKNWAQPNGTQLSNPAGLMYALHIDGNCEDDFFQNQCSLFGETDLDGSQKFFNFNDIKPGDEGRNVISLHVYDNDAWACLIAHDGEDDENVVMEPEEELGDDDSEGELQDYINFFAWSDTDGDGEYENGEEQLGTATLGNLGDIVNYDSDNGEFLSASTTKYVGLAWCAGTISVNENEITCDGSTMLNDAQSDTFMADLTAYAVQKRNNDGFLCSDVTLPGEESEVQFVLDSENSPGIEDNIEGETTNNAVNGQPWIDWESVEGGVKFTFHNPTNSLFVFEYQVDNEAGVPRDGANSTGGNLTNVVISEGPLATQTFGETYNRVLITGPDSEEVTVLGNEEIRVGVREGAEQHWYIDWITFVGNVI